MKKNKKKIYILLAVCIAIVGGAILSLGIVLGGDINYLNVNQKTLSWWPFKHISVGYGGVGYNVASNMKRATHTQTFNSVKSIDVDIKYGEVTLLKGNMNEIRYSSSENDALQVVESGNELKVTAQNGQRFGLDFRGDYEKGIDVFITLKDDIYDKIKVYCSLGDINMMDVKTKSLNVISRLGSIDLENIYSENSVIDQSAGDIDISGILLNQSIINNKLGDSDIEIYKSEQEYRYQLITNIGDQEVNGREYEGNGDITQGNPNASNIIAITNSMGDIDLQFH